MKSSIIIMAIIGLLSSSAQASDWQLIGGSSVRYAYVDASSIVMQKSYRKAWILTSELENQVHPVRGTQSASRSTKALNYFNCAERTWATTQLTNYSEVMGQGEVVFSAKYPLTPSSFEDVIPDSVAELEFNYVCSRKLK